MDFDASRAVSRRISPVSVWLGAWREKKRPRQPTDPASPTLYQIRFSISINNYCFLIAAHADLQLNQLANVN